MPQVPPWCDQRRPVLQQHLAAVGAGAVQQQPGGARATPVPVAERAERPAVGRGHHGTVNPFAASRAQHGVRPEPRAGRIRDRRARRRLHRVPGGPPSHRAAAAAFAADLARAGVGIVYGGGRVGLMGVVADAALAAGGEVVGVIPQHLVDDELAHPGLPRLDVVDSMHERKARMAELADVFVALPGAAGTLEELFEAWTWGMLGLHAKPTALVDVDGFWQPLLAQLRRMVDDGYLDAARLDALGVVTDAAGAARLRRRLRAPGAQVDGTAGSVRRPSVGPVERWDVVVVGGGPAGAACAAAARQADPAARVLVLDRADFPRDKVCGDGIAPEAFDVLDGLGIDRAALTEGFPPVARLRLRSPGGATVERAMPRPAFVVPARGPRRPAARRGAGRRAELRRHAVRRLDRAPGRTWRSTACSTAGVSWGPTARSPSSAGDGLPAQPAGRMAVAIRGYAPDRPAGRRPADRTTEQRWPAYAWSFPLGDGRANVGYGELVSRRRDPRRPARRARAAAARGAPDGLRAHRLPLSTGRPRQPDGRVLLAGDAASLINPLTGEGIFYAVLSGTLAGAAARPAPTPARPTAARCSSGWPGTCGTRRRRSRLSGWPR